MYFLTSLTAVIELVAVERLTADAAGVALIMRWGYRKYRKAHHPCGGVVETGQAVQRYLYRNFLIIMYKSDRPMRLRTM